MAREAKEQVKAFSSVFFPQECYRESPVHCHEIATAFNGTVLTVSLCTACRQQFNGNRSYSEPHVLSGTFII